MASGFTTLREEWLVTGESVWDGGVSGDVQMLLLLELTDLSKYW